MKRFEFKLVSLDRAGLRKNESQELKQLNAAGSEGWQVIHVKEDVQNNRDLLLFLEREVG
jgi:hypothetical protein